MTRDENDENKPRGNAAQRRAMLKRSSRVHGQSSHAGQSETAGKTENAGSSEAAGKSEGKRRAASPRASSIQAEEAGARSERQRIAKLMARVGLCSRRDAESWILAGRVSVNGAVLTSPAVDVGTEDTVLVDGAPLPTADKTRLFLFHKPRGLITSDHDPEGRATIFDHLHEHWPDGPRVVTIGRLDINTEGLLLLTNDGGLARILELPQTGWVRRYRVRAKGETDQAVLDRLAGGVTIDGIDYAGIEAKLDRVQGANCWLTMGLREGKNREVKRVLEHIGLEVNRLIRLSFGPFQLLDLPEGQVEEVRTRILRDQLGPSLSAQAGVDFTEIEAIAPIVAAPVSGPIRGKDRGDRAGGRVTMSLPRTTESQPHVTSPSARAKPRKTLLKTEAPRGRNFRERDRDEDVAPPEKRERPTAGPRKHVSALRTATGVAIKSGPRKRLERTDTTDRKDRTVRVERLVTTSTDAAPGRRPERRERPSATTGASRRSGQDGRQDGRASKREDARAPKREARISQSALGKRERVARSGGVARTQTEAPNEERRPVRARVERGFSQNRAARSDERAARSKPSSERSASRPGRDAAAAPRTRDAAYTARTRDATEAARPRSGKPPGSAKPFVSKSSGERPAGRSPAARRVDERRDERPRSAPKRGPAPARGAGGKPAGERPARQRTEGGKPSRGRPERAGGSEARRGGASKGASGAKRPGGGGGRPPRPRA